MIYKSIFLFVIAGYSNLFSLGSYTTVKPSTLTLPSIKYVSSTLQRPVITTDWCSSIVFDSTSNVMFAHPFAFKCDTDGVWIGYPNKGFTGDTYYSFAFNKDIKVSVNNLNSKVVLDNYSDWAVTASWKNGTLKATMGHGMPFAYFSSSAGIVIKHTVTPNVWSNSNGCVALTIGDRHYALFAPSGSIWNSTSTALSSSLNGKSYFSIAVLPDTLASTLAYFKRFAFNFVTDTKVNWYYDMNASRLKTVYESTIDKKDSSESTLLYALYPHQWQYCKGALSKYTYESVRGKMKLIEGMSFETVMPYSGVLPSLPLMSQGVSGFSLEKLKGYINNEKLKSPDQLIKADNDTYCSN